MARERFELTICGLDELGDHAGAGVSHAISILDPEAPVPRVFGAYATLRDHWVLRFHDISRPLRGARPPEREDVAELLSYGEALARAEGPAHLLIHCHAGISRSTAAAAIVLAQHRPGREIEAFRKVVRLRPMAWPNSRMIRLADDLLGRGGRLTSALDALGGH